MKTEKARKTSSASNLILLTRIVENTKIQFFLIYPSIKY